MSETGKIAIDSVVSQSTNQVACELDGETVMMHIDSGEYFGCDSIGSRIWELLEEPRAVADVCETLVSEFDVEREQCECDVLTFLNDLVSESLVERVISAAA